MPLHDDRARETREELFGKAEQYTLGESAPPVEGNLVHCFDVIFNSKTQAYREVLLGCALARLQDKTFDIRLPYVNQGPAAFNGRTLDERVVNPFLHEHRVPSSRGPYLGVFRRSVRFDQATRRGLRDKTGYDAFLNLVEYLEGPTDEASERNFILYLLFMFVRLREAAEVRLFRIHRIALEQCDRLVTGLLETPSGGRLPVFLVVATFHALQDAFELNWEIEHQGINVADTAAGVGGDDPEVPQSLQVAGNDKLRVLSTRFSHPEVCDN